MSKTLLKADHVSKSYRRGGQTIPALRDVSLAVSEGEIISIMGPSGCGKSTLLLLLGGLDQPTSGRIYLEDVDLKTATCGQLVDLRRRACGFIFQSDQLLPTLTLQENVALPAAVNGADLPECERRAKGLLESVGLARKLDALPGEVSGGQRQLAAIARALANAPAIVLADEPTGSLDSATAKDVVDRLLESLKKRNCAMVMVTHDQKIASRADRFLFMRDGVIVDSQEGH